MLSFKRITILSWLKIYAKKITVLILTVAAVVFAWTNVCFPRTMSADLTIFDRVSGHLEGTVERYVGKIERFKGRRTFNVARKKTAIQF